MSVRPAPSACRVAIAGASSLRGKELKQVLEERNFPALDFVLLDESLAVGTLTEAGGEPTFIRAMEEESFERARFAFFAGAAENAARHWAVARRAGSTVIDLTGGLSAAPAAIPWIPSLSKALPPPSLSPDVPREGGVYCSPPTAVIVATTLAAGLACLSPVRLALLFFPPVSERDQAGVDELESQTTQLLSFQTVSQPIFDAQVAFNLLWGYGEDSRPRLEDVRTQIASDVAKYLAGRAILPAIQLIQAPIFYGYAFAAYAEFAEPRETTDLEEALGMVGVQFAAAGEPAPTNVSVAGSSEIQLARVERDPNVPRGFWLWGVTDNLRVAATNAVRIAEELLAC
jgi:aspartate-semialdehyde dehydrogenase